MSVEDFTQSSISDLACNAENNRWWRDRSLCLHFITEEQTAQLLAAALDGGSREAQTFAQRPGPDPLETLLATAARVRNTPRVICLRHSRICPNFLASFY